MKYLKFLGAGILFGILLTKAEIISWFRIQEMFRFQSFHMYGIIGSAVVLGMLGLMYMEKRQIKSLTRQVITVPKKEEGIARYLIGGTIFGLGWALTGACPGPMFALLGTGAWSILIVIVGALMGTWTYGVLRRFLPH